MTCAYTCIKDPRTRVILGVEHDDGRTPVAEREAMPVPEALSVEDFRAALRLWRWQRRMAGQTEGDRPASRSGVHPIETSGALPAPRRIG